MLFRSVDLKTAQMARETCQCTDASVPFAVTVAATSKPRSLHAGRLVSGLSAALAFPYGREGSVDVLTPASATFARSQFHDPPGSVGGSFALCPHKEERWQST